MNGGSSKGKKEMSKVSSVSKRNPEVSEKLFSQLRSSLVHRGLWLTQMPNTSLTPRLVPHRMKAPSEGAGWFLSLT